MFTVIDFKPLAFGPYVLPPWAQTIGWLVALAPAAAIVLYALVVCCGLCRSSDCGKLSHSQVCHLLFTSNIMQLFILLEDNRRKKNNFCKAKNPTTKALTINLTRIKYLPPPPPSWGNHPPQTHLPLSTQPTPKRLNHRWSQTQPSAWITHA